MKSRYKCHYKCYQIQLNDNDSPKMYIIVKQLSKAIPTKNLHMQKLKNEPHQVVAIPLRNPIRFDPTRAGSRPNLSANHPNIKPPNIAPPKNIAWAVWGEAAFSQTQFSWKKNRSWKKLQKKWYWELTKKTDRFRIRIQTNIRKKSFPSYITNCNN